MSKPIDTSKYNLPGGQAKPGGKATGKKGEPGDPAPAAVDPGESVDPVTGEVLGLTSMPSLKEITDAGGIFWTRKIVSIRAFEQGASPGPIFGVFCGLTTRTIAEKDQAGNVIGPKEVVMAVIAHESTFYCIWLTSQMAELARYVPGAYVALEYLGEVANTGVKRIYDVNVAAMHDSLMPPRFRERAVAYRDVVGRYLPMVGIVDSEWVEGFLLPADGRGLPRELEASLSEQIFELSSGDQTGKPDIAEAAPTESTSTK